MWIDRKNSLPDIHIPYGLKATGILFTALLATACGPDAGAGARAPQVDQPSGGMGNCPEGMEPWWRLEWTGTYHPEGVLDSTLDFEFLGAEYKQGFTIPIKAECPNEVFGVNGYDKSNLVVFPIRQCFISDAIRQGCVPK